MGLQELIGSLGDNPYFGAGFGLFGLGIASAILRRGVVIGTVLFRRHYMTTLEVPCRDKSYQWLLTWITEKGAKKTQHLSVETKFTQIETGKIITKHEFIPSIGEHFFWYKGSWIKVDRSRSEKTVDFNLSMPFETVTITTIGKKRDLFYTILNEARELAVEKTAGKTIMYTAMGSEWNIFGHPRKPRPLHSVVLDEGLTDDIVNDVREFMTCSDWYIDRGIPYRRGYLLHGPPGCGKSSFITALAGHLQLAVCVLNLSERGLSDDRLNHLLAVAPENSIILLEDIDSAFVSRQDSEKVRSAYDGLTPVTFSGLLNCLDGVASTEARIVFMTTNYPERLDKALIRPGRVDMIRHIGYCTRHQLEVLYTRFYPEQARSVSVSFAQSVLELGSDMSAAEIQGHFQLYKHDPVGALEDMNNLRQGRTAVWQAQGTGNVTNNRGLCTIASASVNKSKGYCMLTSPINNVRPSEMVHNVNSLSGITKKGYQTLKYNVFSDITTKKGYHGLSSGYLGRSKTYNSTGIGYLTNRRYDNTSSYNRLLS
uniref:Mitochondrial chaperone BCS1 n=1 Tax=Hirondellea gigas TaxID=1518452 RepID=A0A2P2I0H4_9CRUS